MRELPDVKSLGDAVRAVIQSNKADGYNPSRFVQITLAGTAPDLKRLCEKLILSGQALDHLDGAFEKHRSLLTLEDFVARYGRDWGYSDEVLDMARQRVIYFDQLAGGPRYS